MDPISDMSPQPDHLAEIHLQNTYQDCIVNNVR